MVDYECYPRECKRVEEERIMNAVIEAVKKRRSIRSYQSKPVSRDIITAVIERAGKKGTPDKLGLAIDEEEIIPIV